MRAIRNICFSDQVDEYRLTFDSWSRDGTQKFFDHTGNAIFVKHDVIIELYSREKGVVVDELELTLNPMEEWQYSNTDETAASESDLEMRKKALRTAWVAMLESLPPLTELSPGTKATRQNYVARS